MSKTRSKVLAIPMLLWEFGIQPLSMVGRVVSGVISLITLILPILIDRIGWSWSISSLLLILLIISWFALYNKNIIKPIITDIIPDFRPFLDCGNVTKNNILILDAKVSFENKSQNPTRAFSYRIEILRQVANREWEVLPLDLIDSDYIAETYLEGLPNDRTDWYPGERMEIKPFDITVADFHIMGEAKERRHILDYPLKLRLSFRLMGMGDVIVEKILPEIKPPAVELQPSTDQSSSKAS